MDVWNTNFLLGLPFFRCYVSFRESNSFDFGSLFQDQSEITTSLRLLGTGFDRGSSLFGLTSDVPVGPKTLYIQICFVFDSHRLKMKNDDDDGGDDDDDDDDNIITTQN